jgi:hypothetical protein
MGSEKLSQELIEITHEYNNIFNTLNGYAELAREAKDTDNEEEYSFFKEKLFLTVEKKIETARVLNERLNNLQTQLTGQ